MDLTLSRKEAGRRGGLATLARHGPDHFRDIGRKGAAVFWERYTLSPAGPSDFAIVKRETGEVIAFTSGGFEMATLAKYGDAISKHDRRYRHLRRYRRRDPLSSEKAMRADRTMPRPRILLLVLLALSALACSLTAGAAAVKIDPTQTATITSAPMTPQTGKAATITPYPTQITCTVTTGHPDGFLTLRACAGTSCAALGWLREGATLVILPQSYQNWIQVRSESVTGWINSTYCKGE